ncbi:ketoacyl-ACP synthase III [bacterium]|nr:ketoacyl-ACP synthase III [bacterium]
MKRIGILGLGYNFPKTILTNAELEKMVDTSDEWITQRTGIKERHIVGNETMANSDMILPAAEKAIAEAGIDKSEIDVIIVGTVTPDYFFPSTAAMLQKKLGIKHAMVLDFSAGCTGFLYGLDIARGLILSGNYKYVLTVGSEQLTKITNWEDRNTCVLFGDGSGAAIVGDMKDDKGHEIIGVLNDGDGHLGDLLIMYGGGSVNPMSHEMIDKKLQYLNMDKGGEVFKHAILNMTKISLNLLKKHDMTTEQIDWLIPHQANIRIMEKVAERLNIPKERVAITVDRYGNTSAASIPMALGTYIDEGKIKEGQMLLMTAFGAGFTWGSAIIKW